MKKKPSFNIKIGGQAGEGIKVSGLTLARSLTRLGFSTFAYSEYPSLIRGGHNTYQIHFSTEPVYSQIKEVDLLVALNQETISLHQKELTERSIILYDPGEFDLPKGKLTGQYLAVEFIKLAEQAGGREIMANMVSLGAVLSLFGLPITSLKELIKKAFQDKGEKVINLNQASAQAGHDFIDQNHQSLKLKLKPAKKPQKRMVLTGNQAIGLGAIAGGLQFFSAYPMTPASSILHYLAAKSREMNLVVKHTEDEISAINMAIGAAFAGSRAMTATSGGGLCLMAEATSFSGVSETPLVIINAQRPGPGLGMPTWTAQADLQMVLRIGHDEFPRVVLAPGDAFEAFDLTKQAMVLAEKYQLPVFVLSDKFLSESDYSPLIFPAVHQNQRLAMLEKVDQPADQPFKRYQLTKRGVSPRPIPGTAGGIHCCNSYEHDQIGYATEKKKLRSKMMDKRLKKEYLIEQEIPKPKVYGSKKAEISLISWGANKGPILQALKTLTGVNFMHLNFIWPFPSQAVAQFIDQAEKVFCLEGNATGQLADLISQETGHRVDGLRKYNGRPFWPEEIVKLIKKGKKG